MSCINQLFTYLLILAVTVYCFDHSAVPMSSLVVSVVSAIIRFFMKLFYTSNTITVKECQMFFFCFNMPIDLETDRKISEAVPEPAECYVTNCE